MRKVIGIGETVLDIIFRENKPVNAVPGGSTFNALVSLGRAGIPVTFISDVGDDKVGRFIVNFLKDNGVDAGHITLRPEHKSPVSLAFLDKNCNAEYSFYHDNDPEVPEFTYPNINAGDIVLFGSFFAVNPRLRPQVEAFLQLAKEKGAILYYDVNFRPSHRNDLLKATPNMIDNLELADIVRGSDEDFGVIYGQRDADKVYKSEISFYCKNFICTQGERPAIIHSAGGLRKEYPVPSQTVVSTIGAGDNFNAGFIYGMIKNNVFGDSIADGMDENTWNSLVGYGQLFSGDCCKDIYNYISADFGESIRNK